MAILCAALLVVACGDEASNSSSELETYGQSVTPAPATSEDPEILAVDFQAGANEAEVDEAIINEMMDVAIPTRVAALAKDGEKLFILSGEGMIARTGDFVATITDQPAVATISFNDQRWIATEGALITADGTVEIVPEFATSFTALAVYEGDLYAGTAGDGVWKLTNGALEPISDAMYVAALVGADFGLFAATDDGLFSFKEDHWLRRRVGDSSVELATPTALYARYPYLYVGTDHGLLTFDGGRWQEFAVAAEVSALGWHNARLYIGSVDGTLTTLEGSVMESAQSPEAGEITSILRFGKRLHVATDEGVFRLRHGRFEKIEWTQPAESEPKTEPIASLL
jgi:hypothetical protein